MDFFRKVTFSKNPISAEQKYYNLDKNQVLRIEEKLKAFAKSGIDKANFESTFSSLGPLLPFLFSHLKEKGDKVHVGKLICLVNNLLGDASDQTNALNGFFSCTKELFSVLVSALESRAQLTSDESRSLLQYLEEDAPNDISKLQNWLVASPLGGPLIKYLFAPLAFMEAVDVFPKLHTETDILNKATILVINANLPMAKRKDWYPLFSTNRQGASFSQLSQKIDAQGPCLLVIESEDGNVFGCFASEGFFTGPLYHGDATTFLFSSKPNIKVYNATGFTNNYAYMNYQQSQLPNGIGVGGYDNVWPLFIHEDFGKGQTLGNVSSFEKCCLNEHEEFKIKAIEAWQVGEKPKKPDVDEMISPTHGRKSILDKDPQTQALLAMSGKSMYSEAHREPEPMLD